MRKIELCLVYEIVTGKNPSQVQENGCSLRLNLELANRVTNKHECLVLSIVHVDKVIWPP